MSVIGIGELRNEPGAMYECFDLADTVIYVGSSYNAKKRIGAHRRTAEWWPEVHRTETTAFPTRLAAMMAEQRVITVDRPRYNYVQALSYDSAKMLLDKGLMTPEDWAHIYEWPIDKVPVDCPRMSFLEFEKFATEVLGKPTERRQRPARVEARRRPTAVSAVLYLPPIWAM
jgi:hypothetical protein